METQQEQIPGYFWPVTGKWRMRGEFNTPLVAQIYDMLMMLDLHKVYVDDEHYNSGHGHAYEKYGVDSEAGAVVVVRPDQCKTTPRKVGLRLTSSRCFQSHNAR